MNYWKKRLIQGLNRIEEQFDRVKFGFKQRFNLFQPFQILPYFGYGTAQFLYLKARVLEKSAISQAQVNDTLWNNLTSTVRRFASDEIPGARVRVHFQEIDIQLIADREGYLEVQLAPTAALDLSRIWHEITLELLEPHVSTQKQPVQTQGYILIPPPQAEFGVISDIDDTVIQTEATSLLTMARIVFLSNAHSRLPFKGVSAFIGLCNRASTSKGITQSFMFPVAPGTSMIFSLIFLQSSRSPWARFFSRNMA